MKNLTIGLIAAFVLQINFSATSQNYLDTLLDYNNINEQAFNMIYVNDSVIQINTTSSDPNNGFERGVLIRNFNLNTFDIVENNFSYGQVSLPIGRSDGSVKSINSDTSYIVYSPYDSDPASQDAYLAAILYADTLWTKNLGIQGVADDFSSVDCYEDSLLIMAGSVKNITTLYDYRFVVTDKAGNIVTTSSVGGSGEDIVLSMTKFTDTSYLLSGFTQSSEFGITGISDFYLVEFSLEGDVLWSHNYGDFERVGGFVNSTSDGNIMVYGFALNDFDSGQSYYAKLSNIGNLIWEKTIDNDTYHDHEFVAFYESLDGYIFIGTCPDPENQKQVGNIVKTDFDGNILWNRKYKRRENGNYFRDILPSDDGGLYVLGFVYPDVIDPNITTDAWLLKLNCLGFKAPPVSEFTYGLDNNFEVQFVNESENFGTCKFIYGDGIEETFTENDPKLNSHTYPDNNTYQVSLITYGCNNESDTVTYSITPSVLSVDEILNQSSFKLYPNPSNSVVTIEHALQNGTIEILDVKGKKVRELKTTSNKEKINVSELDKGIYFLRLSNNTSRITKRFVVN